MKYRAQILIVNGRKTGIVHGDCDCFVRLSLVGEFDAYEDAAKAACVAGRTTKPCPVAFPHGRPVFHAVSGDLVGYLKGTKFLPVD